MEKCLVTKLQGSVSGDLPYFGALKITVKKADNITTTTQRRLVMYTNDINCRIFTADGSSKLSDKEDLSNPSSSFVFKNMYMPNSYDKREIFFLDGDYTVYITGKYDITRLEKWGDMGNYSFDIEELKYCTPLIYLILNSINLTGDISSLANLTELSTLTLTDSSVTGAFETYLSALSAKRTSGSCRYWLSGSNITYNGERWISGKKFVEFNSDGCNVYEGENNTGKKIATYVKSTNTWSYTN